MYGLTYPLATPAYIPYAIESLGGILGLAAIIASPTAVVTVAFLVDLYRGLGLLKRKS